MNNIRIEKKASVKESGRRRVERSGNGAGKRFQDALRDTRDEILRKHLDDILSSVDSAAVELKKSQTQENLSSYKKKVRSFLEAVINEAYKVSGKGVLHSMKVVDMVNKELEGLTRDFLDKEKGHLILLSKFDEIRGLLLDLYQ